MSVYLTTSYYEEMSVIQLGVKRDGTVKAVKLHAFLKCLKEAMSPLVRYSP